MKSSVSLIKVQDIDHCGIVAGIIDSMCLVEQINQILGRHPQEIVTPGQGEASLPYHLLHFLRQNHKLWVH